MPVLAGIEADVVGGTEMLVLELEATDEAGVDICTGIEVELGSANVCVLPITVIVYGVPAKFRTGSHEPQLQPSLQQYESDVVVLQLKTGFPDWVSEKQIQSSALRFRLRTTLGSSLDLPDSQNLGHAADSKLGSVQVPRAYVKATGS